MIIEAQALRGGLSEEQRKLAENNIYLSKSIATKLSDRLPRHIEKEDLISAGNLGLLNAAKLYNPHMKVKFHTYASLRVLGSMLDLLRENDILPRSARTFLKDHEKRVESGDLEERTERYSRKLNRVLSGEKINMASSDSRVLMDVADSDSDAIASVVNHDLVDQIYQTISHLSEREKAVFLGIFKEEHSYKQIAKKLRVTGSRVCQVKRKIIRKIRETISSQGKITSLPEVAIPTYSNKSYLWRDISQFSHLLTPSCKNLYVLFREQKGITKNIAPILGLSFSRTALLLDNLEKKIEFLSSRPLSSLNRETLYYLASHTHGFSTGELLYLGKRRGFNFTPLRSFCRSQNIGEKKLDAIVGESDSKIIRKGIRRYIEDTKELRERISVNNPEGYKINLRNIKISQFSNLLPPQDIQLLSYLKSNKISVTEMSRLLGLKKRMVYEKVTNLYKKLEFLCFQDISSLDGHTIPYLAPHDYGFTPQDLFNLGNRLGHSYLRMSDFCHRLKMSASQVEGHLRKHESSSIQIGNGSYVQDPEKYISLIRQERAPSQNKRTQNRISQDLKKGRFTLQELRQKYNITKSSVKHYVSRLVQEGKVIKEKSGPNQYVYHSN